MTKNLRTTIPKGHNNICITRAQFMLNTFFVL